MKKASIIIITAILSLTACDVLVETLETSTRTIGPAPLTTNEIISGLKEALKVGTNNAVGTLSKENGFYKNPLLKIPFPEDAKIVEEKLRGLGLNKMIDDFIQNMNKGAEKAVTAASPIFIDAIKEMTITDAKNILNGSDNAATEYFRKKTSTKLFNLFKPQVQKTLDEVEVTKYWKNVTGTYNKIPFTSKVETDLSKYVTNKTLDGLFFKLAEEEKLIRTDPVARVNDILKRVFGD